MKKFWLHSLALSIGLVGSTTVLGQYPSSPNNLGASSYPVNAQVQNFVQSLPTVPQQFAPQMQQNPQQPAYSTPHASPFQLTSGQDVYQTPSYGQAAQQVVPQVVPQQPVAPTAQSAYPPAVDNYAGNQAPMTQAAPPVGAAGCQSCATGAVGAYDYGYQQAIAPTATYGNSYCGTQSAFSAPAPAFGMGQRIARRPGLSSGAKPWFFGGGVMLFNRVDSKNKSLSFADSAYSPDILGTQDARMGVMTGFEVSAGRYFNCGKNAIQMSYFGIFSDDEMAERSGTAGAYRSRIPFTYVDILDPTLAGPYGTPTTGVYDWFDAAFTHRIERSSNFHSLEVNLLGFAVGGAARTFNLPTAGTMFSGTRGRTGCGYCGGGGCGACGGASSACGGCGTACGGTCGSPRYATGPCGLTGPSCGSKLNLTWLAGVRYFRFEDNLTYAASLNDSMITRSTDDLYYDVNTTNDLVGFQLGSRLDYCAGKRINVYGTAKAGIYGNQSSLYTRIATEFQTAYLNDTRTPTNPNQGSSYFFNETKTDVAFLSELGTGLGIRMSPKWTATVGYRAIAASGVATSPDNVQYGFANYADIRDFDNYGTLILHGINIGALYNF